ncbi:transcription elongation factor GreA [Deinobacterium chartae]|uniref:Transcription elongation factor GreA n=1 Tax=Deinobacterium chartae TaxID=521158 RepID=A0A841HYU4_9DEIO|nr:GreA/GreB family elongation factor [Deinobacterium chartae]MBB6098063.1 transcription elongation factor GreA [Deinobacterium chartae]
MAREIKLTQEGFDRLRRTLEQEQTRLIEATRNLQLQMEASDDYEDNGLEEAKREKMAIEMRIEELEDTLARATIIAGSGDAETAGLGALIVLHDEKTGKEMKVQLVSAPEASVLGGSLPRISEDSPVGLQLMGRKIGESFVVNLDEGRRQLKYRVVSIEY